MGWASLRPCLTNSKFSRNAYLQDSLRSCGCKLVDKLLVQGNSAERVTDTDHLWLCAFGGIGAPVTTVSALNFHSFSQLAGSDAGC